MAYGRVNVSGKQIKYNTNLLNYSQTNTEYTLFKATNPTISYNVLFDYPVSSNPTYKMWLKNYTSTYYYLYVNNVEVFSVSKGSNNGLRFYNFTITAISDTQFLISFSVEYDAYTGTKNRPDETITKIITTSKQSNIIDSIKIKSSGQNINYDLNYNYYTIEL